MLYTGEILRQVSFTSQIRECNLRAVNVAWNLVTRLFSDIRIPTEWHLLD